MDNKFLAEFTGSYPTRCMGEWKLHKNGKDISEFIPQKLKKEPMGTYGKYESWFFNEDYIEEFSSYYDGLKQEDWIKENKYWLDKISKDISDHKKIFEAINRSDFRCNSCGGCI